MRAHLTHYEGGTRYGIVMAMITFWKPVPKMATRQGGGDEWERHEHP